MLRKAYITNVIASRVSLGGSVPVFGEPNFSESTAVPAVNLSWYHQLSRDSQEY